MSDLIVASFNDPGTAETALASLRSLKQSGVAGIDDAAIVSKDPDGKVRIKNSLDGATVGGAAVGAFLGAVFFLFFPLLGLVTGAIGGALVGHSLGQHIDKSFVEEVTKQLDAGQSALFVMLHSENAAAVISALRPIEGGTLIQTTLEPDLENAVREALK